MARTYRILTACLAFASIGLALVTSALDRLADFVLAVVPRPPGLMLATVGANVPRASTPISSTLYHANRHEARSARLGSQRHV